MMARPLARLAVLATALGLLAACQSSTPAVTFHGSDDPANLSAWHVLKVQNGYLKLNDGVLPYDVNAKLFSDYAYKLRTVWMPDGSAAQYTSEDHLDFPVGTIISKTFYYPVPEGAERRGTQVEKTYRDLGYFTAGKGLKLANVHLIETRLLVHREQGWVGLPYVWNDAQTAAHLSRIGDAQELVLVDDQGQHTPFTYVVPAVNQCATCHNYVDKGDSRESERRIVPIGPTASHLNRPFAYASGRANQLEHWSEVGYLTGLPELAKVPKAAQWMDTSQPLTARARSYLDANCAFCHNPHGEANYTSLWLEYDQPFGMHTGECKTPVAAGPATGGRLFDLVPGAPDKSILTHRMASTEVGVMMPELGRTTADHKGVALIRAWIASLEGDCNIIHG